MAAIDRKDLNLTPEEHAALHLLDRLGLEPPLDLEEIVARFADVESLPFPMKGDAILVEYPKDHRRPLIILNSNRPNPARRRFTLAHELGHILLAWHYGNFACMPSVNDDYMSGDYWTTECEANRFASELLMPTPWMLKFIVQFSSIEDLVVNMMEVASVSIDAARIKLMKCLPAGYICIVEDHAGGQPRIELSRGTPGSLIYDYGDYQHFDSMQEKIQKVAVDYHEEVRPHRTTRLWKISCITEVPPSSDFRQSKEILNSIMSELFGESPFSTLLKKRIHSIVGATNGLAMSRDVKDIYGVLKLRFAKSDITGDVNLVRARNHKSFENFLINRAVEIASGKTGKMKSFGHQLPPTSLFD